MSKMDNLRAMREARYERGRAQGSQATTSPSRARPVAMPPTSEAPTPDEPADAEAVEALCGHRNMGGRTCTREAGHAAKSHRYS
jgi:hypothetical protein